MKIMRWIVYLNLFLVLLTPGCWDRRETETLLITDALAVDYEKTDEGGGKFLLTLSSLTFQPGEMGMGMGQGESEEGPPLTWVASSYGNSLEEALMNLTNRSPRYIYLGHKEVVLIGEDAAREITTQFFDFIIRREDTRLRTPVLVTRGQAAEIFRGQPEFAETLPFEIFEILLRGSQQEGYIVLSDTKTFMENILTHGQDPWAPVLETFAPEEPGEEQNEPAIRISGTALFSGERLVGYMDETASKGFAILKGFNKRGVLTVSTDTGGIASLTYDSVNVKRTLEITEGKIGVNYEVKLRGLINEISFQTALASAELAAIEQKFSQEANNHFLQTARQLQEANADPLGMGRAIHIKYPEIWKEIKSDWREIYPDINITFDTSVDIVGSRLGFWPLVDN